MIAALQFWPHKLQNIWWSRLTNHNVHSKTFFQKDTNFTDFMLRIWVRSEMVCRLSSCCSCMHYTTWRGSLSVSDRIILILFSKWTPSISRRSERKPRSVLLCSQRMTLIPWEAASRISWWDISPTNKGKSKYLSTKHSLWNADS